MNPIATLDRYLFGATPETRKEMRGFACVAVPLVVLVIVGEWTLRKLRVPFMTGGRSCE